jgi:hypothetical protein
MFSSTCANPACTTDFDYRRGRLFRFQRAPQNEGRTVSSCVEHFWLCDACSSAYTIAYLGGRGVLLGLELTAAVARRAATRDSAFYEQ